MVADLKTELAREGAAAMLVRLERKAAEIRRMFPGLNGSPKRKRVSHMSAAARKAQSQRMKIYWAAKRKAKAR